MVRAFTLSFAVALLTCAAAAQQPADTPQVPTTTFEVKSQLVLVPATVETKKGDILYGLNASQFVVEDNGVPQRVRMEESDMDARSLSLVVVAQCSLSDYRQAFNTSGLATMVDALLGAAPSEVAVIRFGSGSDLVSGFTSDETRRNEALSQLQPCDDAGDTIYDALDYANTLLEAHHAKGRRAILLLSETRDHGSETKADAVIQELARSNTVLNAVSFLPGKTELGDELKGNPGSGVIGLLIMAVEALRKNAPRELARLSGGEYLTFTNRKGFERGLATLANHVHNYYLLSFTPTFPADAAGVAAAAPSLHSLVVKVPAYDATIRHRESYWLTQPTAPVSAPKP